MSSARRPRSADHSDISAISRFLGSRSSQSCAVGRVSRSDESFRIGDSRQEGRQRGAELGDVARRVGRLGRDLDKLRARNGRGQRLRVGQADGPRSRLVPITSVGTAIDRASASPTPGPSPDMADSSAANACAVLGSEEIFACESRLSGASRASLCGRRRGLEIGACPRAHRDCADALQPPHRAACWRAPRATAMPGAPAPGR